METPSDTDTNDGGYDDDEVCWEEEEEEEEEPGEIKSEVKEMDETPDSKQSKKKPLSVYQPYLAKQIALELQANHKCESQSFSRHSNPMGHLHKGSYCFVSYKTLLDTLVKSDFLDKNLHKDWIIHSLQQVQKWIPQNTQLAIEIDPKENEWRFKAATYGDTCWQHATAKTKWYGISSICPTHDKEVGVHLERAENALHYVADTLHQCSLSREAPKQAYLGKIRLQDCYFACMLEITGNIAELLRLALHPDVKSKGLSLVDRGKGVIIQLR